MTSKTLSLIYTTVSNITEAKQIVSQLLSKKIICCANIHSTGQSMYWDNNEIVSSEEIFILMKTPQQNADNAINELKNIHPYETPCIICIDSNKTNDEYLKWAHSNCIK